MDTKFRQGIILMLTGIAVILVTVLYASLAQDGWNEFCYGSGGQMVCHNDTATPLALWITPWVGGILVAAGGIMAWPRPATSRLDRAIAKQRSQP